MYLLQICYNLDSNFKKRPRFRRHGNSKVLWYGLINIILYKMETRIAMHLIYVVMNFEGWK